MALSEITLQPQSVTSQHIADFDDARLPRILYDELQNLEQWAVKNRKLASQAHIAFWALKIPAIVFSASSGLVAYLQVPALGAVLGALASLCVLLDALYPRGRLRNSHLRAYHEIRSLNGDIVSKWRAACLRESADNEFAAKLIDEVRLARYSIARRIADASTSLGEPVREQEVLPSEEASNRITGGT